MKCSEYQLMISRLIDGEVAPGSSAPIFAHVASCGECRGFYHQIQALNLSLESLAEPLPDAAGEESAAAQVLDRSGRRSWWRREVELRVPLLMLLIAIAAAGVLFSFSQSLRLNEPEAIYVTRLPDVVIRAEGPHAYPGN